MTFTACLSCRGTITAVDVVETVGVTAETEEEAVVIAEDIVADIVVHLTEVTVGIGVTATAVMVIVVEAATVEAVAVEAAAAMNAHRTKQGQVTAAAVQMTTTADREVTIGMVHLHRQNERGDMNRNHQEAMEALPLVGRRHQIIMRSVKQGFKLSVYQRRVVQLNCKHRQMLKSAPCFSQIFDENISIIFLRFG